MRNKNVFDELTTDFQQKSRELTIHNIYFIKMIGNENQGQQISSRLKEKLRQSEIFSIKVQSATTSEPQPQKWCVTSIGKYILYLQKNQQTIETKSKTELWDEWKKMAKYIQTKNYRQCRIYHKKMLKQYSSIKNIINGAQEHEPQLKNQLDRLIQIQNIEKFQQNQKNYKEEGPTGIGGYASEIPVPSVSKIQNHLQFPPQTTINPLQYFNQRLPQKTLQNEWKECHEYFLQYLIRLQALMLIEGSL